MRMMGGRLFSVALAALMTIITTQAARAAEISDSLRTKIEERLDAGMADGMRDNLIAGGSAIIVTGDDVVIRQGYGLSNIENQTPFSPDAPVVLASVTKPIIATVTARAVSLGLLSFDDRIDQYLPEFKSVPLASGGPGLPAPTIAQLLSHTGGILGNAGRDAWLRSLPRETPTPDTVNRLVVRYLAERGYAYEPGTEFRYSGLGFNIVAVILQELTETADFQPMVEQLLFDPLGTTTLTFRPGADLIARMATRYTRQEDSLVAVPPIQLRRIPSYLNAGANLVATPDDLGVLAQLHLNTGKHGGEPLIDPAALNILYTRQPAARDRGLGFRVLDLRPDGAGTYLRHGGASGTQFWFDLRTGVGGAILTQTPARQTNGFALRLSQDIVNLIRTEMGVEVIAAQDPNQAAN